MMPDLAGEMAVLGQRVGIAAMVLVTILSTATGVEPASALIRGGLGLTTFSALGWVSALALAATAPEATPRDENAEETEPNPDVESAEGKAPEGVTS